MQKNGKTYIVDPSDNYIGLDDKRVLHVPLIDLPWITAQMLVSLYSTLGWKAIITPDITHETLRKARTVCSGRECLFFLAMMGKAVAHLESRPRNEITVFHLPDQEGPCQNGSWYDAMSVILERMGQQNAVGVWPTLKNNYIGGGYRAALLMIATCIVGDLMNEVRSSLRCLALDPKAALSLLDEYEQDLLTAGKKGLRATERELRVIAGKLAKIPVSASPKEAPKVLLFGGIGRIFVDKPVRDFFEERGILTKTSDISESISLLESEWLVQSGLANKHTSFKVNYSIFTILGDLIKTRMSKRTRMAFHARLHLQAIEMLEKRWRKIMEASGLLFSPSVPFRKLAGEEHRFSWNSVSEAPATVARYCHGLKDNAFDGYVNIGIFNCVPANTATAIINALTKYNDVPYAVIEADGTAITPSQIRQLETVAAQCMRL